MLLGANVNMDYSFLECLNPEKSPKYADELGSLCLFTYVL